MGTLSDEIPVIALQELDPLAVGKAFVGFMKYFALTAREGLSGAHRRNLVWRVPPAPSREIPEYKRMAPKIKFFGAPDRVPPVWWATDAGWVDSYPTPPPPGGGG